MSTEALVVRAQEVKEQIERVRTSLIDNYFDLAELLTEVQDKEYHRQWGYERFDDWVVEGSGLKFKSRQAYYMTNIIRKSRALGLSREELKQIPTSSLKEIFTLDAETQGEQIKALVGKGADLSVDNIKEEVQQIKVGAGGEIFKYLNLKVTKTGLENVIEPAIERCRREFGNTIDGQSGELIDISIGRAIELICGDYLSGPDPLQPGE